jgi:hypothetical protein
MGRSGARNTIYAQECLKRTAEGARLAEATKRSGLREYLTKLALVWMQSTITAERNERLTAVRGASVERSIYLAGSYSGSTYLGDRRAAMAWPSVRRELQTLAVAVQLEDLS